MIKDNLMIIKEEIDKIKYSAGLNYNIDLMVVSKTRSIEEIVETINYGQVLFGENRILEAYEKFNNDNIKKRNVELHIIGHLQRNKAKKACEIAAMIQSIDKIETLDAVEKNCSFLNKSMDYLIEINTSGELQKHGVHPENLNNLVENIYKKDYKYSNIRGFMTVGPLTDNENEIKKSFKLLNKLYLNIKEQIKKDDFNILSMGMSSDYKIAIQEGSNLIRIGSAVFNV